MKNYPEDVDANFPFAELNDSMFNSGFYEKHINYLLQIISYYDFGSKDSINIIIVVLNVISIIISDSIFQLCFRI